MLNPFVSGLIQVLLLIILAPLVNGIIKKLKALSQHRKGMPVLQLYYDILKLFKKDVIIPANSSWIFRVTPYIYFVSVAAAGMIIPIVPQLFSFSFTGDAILAIYTLAMSRFFIALAGLDTGSTFGGMGSSREMMISSLIEPSLLVSIFVLGLNPIAGSTNVRLLYEGSIKLGTGVINPVYMLLLAAMVIVLIAETARIPVDDPATHLELTMVHEAMILEYSGRYLALIELSSSMKQLLFISFILNVFVPFGSSLGLGAGFAVTIVLFLLKMILAAVVIALIEINTVKLRLFSVPNLAALAFIFSMLGFMSGFIFGR